MRTYNIALTEGIDYDTFWDEMETDGIGGVHIPERAVDIINERPTSLRQCWYELSDSEADLLRQDPRVYCVEIPPEYRDDIQIFPSVDQTGLYYKVSGTNPANNLGINWGLFRLASQTNNTTDQSGTLTYSYIGDYDGSGVDVVITDSGCQIDHPEFSDAIGVTRVQQINWFTASGVSGTMPEFNVFYTDNDGHGTHCTGIAAGKTYGRAKNSRIYVMSIDGLTRSPTVGISYTSALDCIKGWHNNKPIDPVTGYKRPTVVNMSWSFVDTFTSITGGVYRGTAWTGTTKQAQYGMIGGFLERYGARVSSVDVDVAELLAAGVVLVGAAGNYYQTLDIPSGLDYNNYFNKTGFGQQYYMRGGSPACTEGVICVGNVDTLYAPTDGTVWNPGVTMEQKNVSSESGPRVDVWAPGTNIVSTTSNTNAFGATTLYPFDSNYKIMSISGTSMASPNIAGIVAQLLQQNPGATPAEIRQEVIDISTPDVLYSTGLTTDYSNTRSLHGGSNRYGYILALGEPTSLSINGPINLTGPMSITYL